MKLEIRCVAIALAVSASIGLASAQTPPPTTVDGLVSAAKIAAGAEPATVAHNFYFLGTKIHSAFDVGGAAVGRCFTMVEGCTTAAKVRAVGTS